MAKITMSIKAEAELKARLEYTIKNTGMSLSDAIKAALFEYCDRWEKDRGKIPQDYIAKRAMELRGDKS